MEAVITAPLMVYKDSDKKLWGHFRFAALPSPGDKIGVVDHAGKVQRLTVMHVLHEPLLMSDEPPLGYEPAWVHARWDDEFF